MNWNRVIACYALVAVLFSLIISPAVCEEPYLRVKGIPDYLVFPLPEGSNQILTATIGGGTPKSVWIAKEKDAKLKIFLTRVATNEYQINLADPELAVLLRSTRGDNHFSVFAEMDDGVIIESIPISYVYRPAVVSPLKCHVYVQDKGKEPQLVMKWRKNWLDPENAVTIELRFDNDDIPSNVRALIEDKTWPISFQEDTPIAKLNITDEIRKLWSSSGGLYVQYQQASRWKTAATLMARPDKLDFLGNAAAMIIYQRRSGEVPGSRGYLKVRLDDITYGQVMLTIYAADGTKYVDTTSVSEGDGVTFKLNGQEYVLYMRRLVNLLVGDDWAEIEVSHLGTSELHKIYRLLAHIETSDVGFIREGNEYNGKEAAIHLRGKFSRAEVKVKTLGEFIDKVASRSSTTGRPYMMKLTDGSTVEAKDWLKEQANVLAKGTIEQKESTEAKQE